MRPARPRRPVAPDTRRRVFVTPEGVDLGMEVGGLGDRLAALLIDLAIQVGLLIAFTLAVTAAMSALGGPAEGRAAAPFAIWTLGFFALRNGYFLAFELGPRAATPGKRLRRLRVAARDGARLTAEAVFARNVLRETEIFLPLFFLFTGAQAAGWAGALAGLAWALGFALLPCFNRDRLRAGDLVAGTWVVSAPRARLLPDLSAAVGAQALPSAFTPDELGAYGERELKVLETVIRRRDRRVVADVARRIRRRIGREATPGERDLDFLDAFYAAQRAKLEHDLLVGRRRLSQGEPARP